MSQLASRTVLALAAACGCVMVLGCGSSRDLDELGVPRPPDAGVWYLDKLKNEADNEGAAGNAGASAVDDGSSPTGSGSKAGSGGAGAGTGGSGTSSGTGSGNGGRGSGTGTGGSSGSGAGSVPLPAAGTSGFPFPGGGSGTGGGSQFPGGGQGMGMAPPPPPSEDVSACSPCESISGTLGGVPACCTDDNQCGADLSALGGGAGCVAREQPGSQSMECPSISIMNGGFQIPGCCRPNGRCGITIMRLAPLGCVEPGVVEDLLSFDTPSGRTGRCTP